LKIFLLCLICCPQPFIETPSEDYEEFLEGFECQTNHETPPCRRGTECTIGSQCGAKDFNSTTGPPNFCGIDETTGEDMFCCSDKNGQSISDLQPPQFPTASNEPRPCVDHSTHCKRWAKNYPESCSPGHESYIFMREVCQSSCKRCGDNGCVDHYEKCQIWSRDGHCATNPLFMFFNCRESCGSCGFKSPQNEEKQIVDRKQYTDVLSSDFTCGESKQREDIAGLEKPKDQIVPKQDNVDSSDSGTCTNVIISDRYAITAAHCFETHAINPREKRISVTIRDGTIYQESIGVRRMWIHPQRNVAFFGAAYFDIAVLELERRIIYDFDKYGDSPACIGKEKNLENQVALTQGFGITENTRDLADFESKLLETNVTLISNEECYNKLRKNQNVNLKGSARRAMPEGVTDQMLCTLGIIKQIGNRTIVSGPCRGDSGGPLYMFDKSGSTKTLVGIQSGGAGCGSVRFKDAPKWWMRVASFADWIECYVKKALTSNISHRNVERKCFRKSKRPFPKKCEHADLTIDTCT